MTQVLGLYVYNIIKINLRPKQNCKIAYFSLKGHVNTQNWSSRRFKISKTSEDFLKRDESIENEKLLLNLSDIKVFFRIERILSKTILGKTISIVSILLHFWGGCIRQITRQI